MKIGTVTNFRFEKTGPVMFRQCIDFPEKVECRRMTEGEVAAREALTGHELGRFVIDIPNRIRHRKTLTCQGEPLRRRLLCIDEHQMAGKPPLQKLPTNAKVEKFVRGNDDVPISLPCEAIYFGSKVNHEPEGAESGSQQVANLAKEIIAEGACVQGEPLTDWG